MTAGGYDAFDDPDAYPGTQVLKNRLGTRDPAVLQAFEVEMTTLRAGEPLPAGCPASCAQTGGCHLAPWPSCPCSPTENAVQGPRQRPYIAVNDALASTFAWM
jgi:hypothetical protein